jgi:hypothetical protein
MAGLTKVRERERERERERAQTTIKKFEIKRRLGGIIISTTKLKFVNAPIMGGRAKGKLCDRGRKKVIRSTFSYLLMQ